MCQDIFQKRNCVYGNGCCGDLVENIFIIGSKLGKSFKSFEIKENYDKRFQDLGCFIGYIVLCFIDVVVVISFRNVIFLYCLYIVYV